jgi:hypothetical protein
VHAQGREPANSVLPFNCIQNTIMTNHPLINAAAESIHRLFAGVDVGADELVLGDP